MSKNQVKNIFIINGSPELLAHADKAVPTVAAVVTDLGYKQDKLTCAGWPDGVSLTDENCWLWRTGYDSNGL